MKSLIKIIIPLVCFMCLVSCLSENAYERVLFDFESDAELDQFYWQCHTLFALSEEHVTHGVKSLRLELYPSDYPGWAPKLDVNDWRRYKALYVDIYNPEDEAIPIVVRIDDRKDFPKYLNRYNKSFIMKPGSNHLKIPLNTLVTTGKHRGLDLKNIYRLIIFMGRPQKKYVLYIDYVRLIKR